MGLVLVIDDEVEICELLVDVLNFSNFEAKSFPLAKEALEFIKVNKNVDAVISDINIPDLNGLDLIAEVKKAGINIPFIFFSGHVDDEQIQHALACGATHVLQKPISTDKIIQTLRDVLTSKNTVTTSSC